MISFIQFLFESYARDKFERAKGLGRLTGHGSDYFRIKKFEDPQINWGKIRRTKEKHFYRIKDLIPTQNHVEHSRIEPHLDDYSMRQYGRNGPPKVLHKNGKKYIIDGHHRIAGERMHGGTHIYADRYEEKE